MKAQKVGLVLAILATLYICLTAWTTVQPLSKPDFPALEELLEQQGLHGQVLSGMVFQANREVFVSGTVKTGEGLLREFTFRQGHLDERPVLKLNR